MTPEELLVVFRNNLRSIREELGMSQSELARRIDGHPGYISDLERGTRGVNLGTLATLSTALGVSPATLISTANVSRTPMEKRGPGRPPSPDNTTRARDFAASR